MLRLKKQFEIKEPKMREHTTCLFRDEELMFVAKEEDKDVIMTISTVMSKEFIWLEDIKKNEDDDMKDK